MNTHQSSGGRFAIGTIVAGLWEMERFSITTSLRRTTIQLQQTICRESVVTALQNLNLIQILLVPEYVNLEKKFNHNPVKIFLIGANQL